MSARSIPVEFEGVRYPSRKALAQHFAATAAAPQEGGMLG
jgi:hypothetical protein